ncbi:MAG: ArsO family NAD(P)H-dependent flavin-containing monooxygenase [Gemmatimonadota bacterium]
MSDDSPDSGHAAGVPSDRYDVVVIGGGQAGLALGYYLRRTELDWVILDDQEIPGGAWTHAWDSLQLFSPARWSSLPGWLMEGAEDEYPTKEDALGYFTAYEARYQLPIRRPIRVESVHRAPDDSYRFVLHTSVGELFARAVISATGTWRNPVLPKPSGGDRFEGVQLHSAEYRNAVPFVGQRVAVVGGGNSAAQILAEVSRVAEVLWCTLEPPSFLPDDVDGRYLFDQATIRYRAQQAGLPPPPSHSLGDIVMVSSVRDARDRGVLVHTPMFTSLTETGAHWEGGRSEPLDAIVWATGFKPALGHLNALDLRTSKRRTPTRGTRSVEEPRLWLVGYGGWTGFASATVIGVGRTARQTVSEVEEALHA